MDYRFGKYIYFDELVKINKGLFKNRNVDRCNVRLMSSEDLIFMNSLLEKLYLDSKGIKNINELLEMVLNTTGTLLYLQPFYDGNSRTLKKFIKIFLKRINIEIVMRKDDKVIPILLEGEVCSSGDVKVLKRKIMY